ncbi:EcsC family protein [uncultured Pseudokineococcus sp.]|uniref:EcsC family protein n=1 Tax=uncultured Pseudokineococcus sp. TaxID=1642928 RepID=UPI00261DEC00|nr:EcsC family protein [uncultured Pseudokineococcus sp.]
MPDASQSTDPEEAAAGLVQRLVDLGIRGAGPLDPAVEVAEAALREAGEPEAALDRLVRQHVRLAGAGGFATGLGGLLTLPVALPANVVAFYALGTRLAAAVAHVRGYDLQDARVREAVLESLVDAGASLPGAAGGGLVTRTLLRGLPTPVRMAVNKGVGFRLLGQTGARVAGRLGRFVPVAGGVIGAGSDAWLMNGIGSRAREDFPAGGTAGLALRA